MNGLFGIDTAKAILDMIGDYLMLQRLAQLKIAAENEHFKNMMCLVVEEFQLNQVSWL